MLNFLTRTAIVIILGIFALWGLPAVFNSSKGIESLPDNLSPTTQVTVTDVLAANIPTPTLTRVKFPNWDFYNSSGIQAEIRTFSQAPMLANLDSMPSKWRQYYPESLPAIAHRLPENPAVVRGCDGIGEYGGVWRRCDRSDWNIYRKIGYESFVRFGPSGEIQPALAWRWTVENNNRVFTFYLRKGQKWSDGHPFTTDDLLWVLDDQFRWPHGNNRPSWSQTTDGRSQLYDFEIFDLKALATEILKENYVEAPSMGKKIAEIGGTEFLQLLEQARNNNTADELLTDKIVNSLNIIIRNEAFFEPGYCDYFDSEKIDLQTQIKTLLGIGQSKLTIDQTIRLNLLREVQDIQRKIRDPHAEIPQIAVGRMNLLAFREYYNDYIAEGRLRHVKIEAVADKTGDTSHIIRFTFERPNAIFLEKTATFMFYTRMFDQPRHKTAPLHVAGSSILNTIDFCQPVKFAEIVYQASENTDKDTPAKRLWQLLDSHGQAIIKNVADGQPANITEEKLQQLIDSINLALKNHEFYLPAAWKNIRSCDEAESIRKKGWLEICNSRPVMRRINQLEICEDLARRFETDGPKSLSEEEMYKLNHRMFRAAFVIDAENPVVSASREDSLNRQAQNHPLGFDSWGRRYSLLWKYDDKYNNDQPTLKPWRVVSSPLEAVSLAVRNPYYYKVDPEGNQLPYLDAIETTIEKRTPNLLLRLASGNVDFQVRNLQFENFSYLKSCESQGNYELRLWANDYCGEVLFKPLQPHADEQYAQLQTMPEFRHALSMAINRQEIIDVVYGGIGTPAQYSVPRGSPYYNEIHAKMSVDYDPERANEILDSLGLGKRRSDGVRLLPNGKPLIMNIETEQDRPLTVVQMVCEYWRKIGIDCRMHIRSYAYISRMMDLGIADITVHKEGGNYFGPVMAGGHALTHPAESTQWYNWAYYLQSGGRKGWAPPEEIMEIQKLWKKVIEAPSEKDKFAAWEALCLRTAQDLPVIGIMTSPGKLVYVRNNFKNVPKIALAGWIAHEPGNCCPESFYMDNSLGDDKGLDKYR